MIIPRNSKRLLSLLVIFAMLFSLFPGYGSYAYAANATTYSGNTDLASVAYAATARVDESVGLRGTVTIQGLTASVGADNATTYTEDSTIATGITSTDTKATASINVANFDKLRVKAVNGDNYTLQKLTMVAIAQITHADGTIDAVQDTQVLAMGKSDSNPGNYSADYTVPDFTSYLKSGDTSLSVEIVAYGDFTYTVPTDNSKILVIDVGSAKMKLASDSSYTGITTNVVNGVKLAAAGSTMIDIDATELTTADIEAVKITGTSIAVAGVTPKATAPVDGLGNQTDVAADADGSITGMTTTKANHVYVHGSAVGDKVNIILDNATILPIPGTTKDNYTDYVDYAYVPSGAAYAPASHVDATAITTTAANAARGTAAAATNTGAAPLMFSNVDAYVTLQGTNILSYNSSVQADTVAQNGIFVDGSASLIITDASTTNKGTLYAGGGGTSAAIGSFGAVPAGYIEIDGGTVTAVSASQSAANAGIGNGYSATAPTIPGVRGIVINGGTVKALGYNYGIGATSGISTTDANRSYVVITDGNVVAEASAGSMGAAVGFANDNTNIVRIGRPDNDATISSGTLTAVNWGYGAGISGKTTFYSGVIKSYSGEYAAAIGGAAISTAKNVVPSLNLYNTSIQYNNTGTTSPGTTTVSMNGSAGEIYGRNTELIADAATDPAMTAYFESLLTTAANTAQGGSDVIVYGGDVTAVAGAFSQKDFTMTSPRGAGRTGTQNIDSQALWGTKGWGAAIGGAVGKDGRFTKIFAGSVKAYSSKFGAGIGGGGAYMSGFTGLESGGTSNATYLGQLTKTGDGKAIDPQIIIKTGDYGAGIGGGGTDISGGTAGAGAPFYVSGGKLTIYGGAYGAGVGGGGTDAASATAGASGSVVISSALTSDNISTSSKTGTKNINIYVGQYGAGIGGGGSVSGTAGNYGSATLNISGGSFNIVTGSTVTYSNTGYVVGTLGSGEISYGAGIGGGGTLSGTAGAGADKAFVSGGYSAITSRGVGAAIGGGGSESGTAGAGGNILITGGTLTAQNDLSALDDSEALTEEELTTLKNQVQGLGGGASVSGTSKITDGVVIITGGNIYTTAGTKIDNAATADQHVWTQPNAAKLPSEPNMYTSAGYDLTTTPTMPASGQDVTLQNTTAEYTEVTINTAARVGSKVEKIGYAYSNAGSTSTYNYYGVDDLYVVPSATDSTKGKVDVWVPATFKLTYDLDGGYVDGSTGYSLTDSSTYAAGRINVIFENSISYPLTGESKELIQWNDLMNSTVTDGLYNGKSYANGTKQYYQLVKHDDVDGNKVAFVGWRLTSDNPILAYGDGVSHEVLETADFSTDNITVYAVWGVDSDGDGVADVNTSQHKLSYQKFTNSPSIVTELLPSYTVQIVSGTPEKSRENGVSYVFMGWSDKTGADGLIVDSNNYNDATVTNILSNLYISGGSITFGSSGRSISGSTEYTMGNNDVELKAVFARDVNGNGIPDYMETTYTLQYALAANNVSLNGSTLPTDTYTREDGSEVAAQYIVGETAVLDTDFANHPKYINIGTEDNPNYVEAEYTQNGVDDAGKATYDYEASASTGIVPTATSDGKAVIFLGWTENKSAASTIWTYGQQGDLPTLLNSVTFEQSKISGGVQTVYPVWSTDHNTNGIPDTQEEYVAYNLKFSNPFANEGKDSDYYAFAGVTMPTDYTNYEKGQSPTYSTKSISEVEGWTFLGWTTYKNKAGAYKTKDQWEASFTSSDAYPYYTVAADGTDPVIRNFNNLTFVNADITVYPIWYKDANFNSKPDWLENADYIVIYNAGTSDQLTGRVQFMPGEDMGVNEIASFDDNAGAKYLFGEKVYLLGTDIRYGVDENGNELYDSQGNALISKADGRPDTASPYLTPSTEDGKTNYMFVGWTPFETETRYFGTDAQAFSNFIKHLTLITDIKYGTDVSGSNNKGEAGATEAQPYVSGNYYTIIGEDEIMSDGNNIWQSWSSLPEAYKKTAFLEQFEAHPGFGLLESVTESSIDFDQNVWPGNDSTNGDQYYTITRSYNDDGTLATEDHGSHTTYKTDNKGSWSVYAVWAVDQNENKIPDMFESYYTLSYNLNDDTGYATNAPASETNIRSGETKLLNTNNNMSRWDPNTGRYMFFLGWTTDKRALGVVYGAGDTPAKQVSSVTFGSYDIEVYAMWGEDLNKNDVADVYESNYKLVYDFNGGNDDGTFNDSSTYSYGSTATLKFGATHEDETDSEGNVVPIVFIGWTTTIPDTDVNGNLLFSGEDDMSRFPGDIYTEDGKNTITFGNGDITLYAVWGTDYDEDGEADILEANENVTYDLHYYAFGTLVDTTSNHAPNSTVNINDDAYTAEQIRSILSNKNVKVPNGFENFEFAGWTTDPEEEDENGDIIPHVYEKGQMVTGADGKETLPYTLADRVVFSYGDESLYAVWLIKSYSINFFDENGNSLADTMPSKTLSTGNEYIFTAPSEDTWPEGKVFGGWAATQGGEPLFLADSRITTSDLDGYGVTILNLYATWRDAGQYVVTYQPNGGIGEPYTDPQTYTEGDTFTVLDNMFTAPEGKQFHGVWATSPDATMGEYTPGQEREITSDLILYAMWVDLPSGGDNEGGGSGNEGGGSGSEGGGSGSEGGGSGTEGGGSGTEGGGSGNEGGGSGNEGGGSGTGTGTTYSVTYNANGGTGTTEDTAKYEADKAVTVKANSFTRSGYTFKEWNTKADGTGTSYSANSTFNMPTGDITLYAIWTASASGGSTGSSSGGSSGGGGGGSATTTTNYTLTFVVNGGSAISSISRTSGTTINLASYTTTRTGYTFGGWYSDSALTKAVTSVTLTANTSVYAKWTNGRSTGSGDGSGSVASPSATGVSTLLNTETRNPYLQGYETPATPSKTSTVGTAGSASVVKTFSPNGNMTRAEVAMMFYRLLRDQDVEITTTFSDVPADSWYGTAVNTLASLGIVTGNAQGLFEPQKAITRAEYTAIAMRFGNLDTTGSASYSDVAQGSWYYDYVIGASKYGWINGYPDGSFKPSSTITRAEVTTMTNRMLGRVADEAYIDSNSDILVQFTDLTSDHWAYYDIMEATNTFTTTTSTTTAAK